MKILFYIAAAVYPLLVFFFLVVLEIPMRSFSVFVILAGFAYFLLATRGSGASVKKKRGFPGGSFLAPSFFLGAVFSVYLPTLPYM
jgi:hypothetical protein